MAGLIRKATNRVDVLCAGKRIYSGGSEYETCPSIYSKIPSKPEEFCHGAK